MKTCPYCAEEIKDAAIVCKHCGRELEPDRVAEVHQSRSSDVTEATPITVATPITMAAPPEKIEPPQSSRIASLVFGSIIIGVAIAAFGAIPRLLDVLEVLEIAGSDPTAIPFLRSLEKDLAGHFLTNLVIYSAIGGLIIWGWRRNRAITLGILFVGFMVLILLGILSVFGQAGASSRPASSVGSSFTLAPTPRSTRTPTSEPSGISAGGSDFFNDDSSSETSAEIIDVDARAFLAFDELLGDWMGEMSSILERQARGVIDQRTAADELDELHNSMELSLRGTTTSKLPLLLQFFKSVVAKFSNAMVSPLSSSEIIGLTTPVPGVSASRYAGALEYLDYAIEKYADYGDFLGFDTWSRVCADAPDHPRCD